MSDITLSVSHVYLSGWGGQARVISVMCAWGEGADMSHISHVCMGGQA